jgi:hypothetical protein
MDGQGAAAAIEESDEPAERTPSPVGPPGLLPPSVGRVSSRVLPESLPSAEWDVGPAPGGRRAPQKTNAFAVVSLLSSLLWLGFIGSLVGVVTGHIARAEIAGARGGERGDALALAGLVVGYIGLATVVLVILLLALAGLRP